MTLKRASRLAKLAKLAEDVRDAANDVSEDLAELGDQYLTKQERKEAKTEFHKDLVALALNFIAFKSKLDKWGVLSEDS